ncbi:FxsA family membrane protein [Actinacidiphila acididurans]|uniref:FxsA family protein n=1 Tax=Actinacidiphila acididurans TaxID=2784346 RepID=A0ABS2U6H1_9ACTN|nr:FxsA family membrane protein [Actinacidiphila acididurans]MBM9510341.1 FxsA family protein [Actinacidiphila acididurans]
MTTSSPPPVRPHPQGQRPRRSRVRTVLPLVIAAWAVLEIWLMTVVADATNGFVVLLAILAGFVLGAAAVKRAGRSAWQNLAASVQQQNAQGAPEGAGAGPGTRLAGGGRTGLQMLGGILLIIPGFLSDAVALLLLFPPTRKLVGAVADRAAARALRNQPAPEPGSLGDLFQQARQAEDQARMRRPDGKVIQGEVVDKDHRS